MSFVQHPLGSNLFLSLWIFVIQYYLNHVDSAIRHVRSRYVGRPHRQFAVPARLAKAYMTAELFCGYLGGSQQYVVVTTRLRFELSENWMFVSPRSVATGS